MIWVYAVVDRPDLPVPCRRGLAHAPLEGVRAGELLAVVSRHDHAPGEPAPGALWAHERVVERLMADRAVLPMRFGTTQPGDAALQAVLAARHDAFRAALGRVRGRVELGVRAIATGNGPVTGPAPAATGREWLLGRLQTSRRDERRAASVHEPLTALAVASRRRATAAPDELLRAAYLVDRATLARFGATVERLQRERDDVAILCTGPWPPYSFVDALAPEPAAAR